MSKESFRNKAIDVLNIPEKFGMALAVGALAVSLFAPSLLYLTHVAPEALAAWGVSAGLVSGVSYMVGERFKAS